MQVVHSEPLPAFLELVGRRQWTVPCMAFDQAGIYQSMVVRTSSRDSLSTVTLAVSNEMNVTWSSAYGLSTNVTSLHPCESGNQLTVRYTQPACSGNDDKVIRRLHLFHRVACWFSAYFRGYRITELFELFRLCLSMWESFLGNRND